MHLSFHGPSAWRACRLYFSTRLVETIHCSKFLSYASPSSKFQAAISVQTRPSPLNRRLIMAAEDSQLPTTDDEELLPNHRMQKKRTKDMSDGTDADVGNNELDVSSGYCFPFARKPRITMELTEPKPNTSIGKKEATTCSNEAKDFKLKVLEATAGKTKVGVPESINGSPPKTRKTEYLDSQRETQPLADTETESDSLPNDPTLE